MLNKFNYNYVFRKPIYKKMYFMYIEVDEKWQKIYTVSCIAKEFWYSVSYVSQVLRDIKMYISVYINYIHRNV